MNYEEAVAYITGRGRFGVRLGLERTRALLARAGSPENRLRGALVAGTNGKGSTSAILASILREAGHRVGLMPKPHLVSYRERIQVDLQPIPAADFASALDLMRPHLDSVAPELGEPTEFEILTALAIVYLQGRVDRLVCEVGLGGRLDATNVLDLGVAVITNVALDHQQQLGTTLEQIATEKAAIIKQGNLVITGAEPPALRMVEEAAAAADATLWRLGREISVDCRPRGWNGFELDVSGPGFEHGKLTLPLLGAYQVENAALAVAAAVAVGGSDGTVTASAVRQGLARVRWPGRLEVVGSAPRILLDGGHNPAALARLATELRLLIGSERLVIVFGAMADKDLPSMLAQMRLLKPESVVFTAVSEDRAAKPEVLRALWQGSATVEPEPMAALERARRLGGKEGNVLVCGSLYLVGELRPGLVYQPLGEELSRRAGPP